MGNTLWNGTVEDVRYHVVDMGNDDALVEELVGERWEAVDDDKAAAVFMTAFIQTRRALSAMYAIADGSSSEESSWKAIEETQNILQIADPFA